MHVYGTGTSLGIIRLGSGSTSTWGFLSGTGTASGALRMYNYSTSSYVHSFTSDNRLGINTTAPNRTLDVNGTGRFAGDVTLNSGVNLAWANGELLSDEGNTGARIVARAKSNPANGDAIFAVESSGSATRFGVTQGYGGWFRDELQVGYPYDTGGLTSPSYTLDVNGTGRFTSDLKVGSNITLDASTGISKANDHQDPSDRRIKTDIVEHNPLDIAKHATLYKYNKRGLIQYGVMAQDLMKYDPEIVGTSKDEEFGEIYTLSGYSLGAIALAGVGKLKSETDLLKERVEELEEKVRMLGGQV
mgnify:CR=1 FL=1